MACAQPATGRARHTHSTASDGTTSPAELVRAARQAGLDVVALTDHDTTAGVAAAAAALPPGLVLLPGAEISCRSTGPDGDSISLHLLAYLFDPTEPDFRAARTNSAGDVVPSDAVLCVCRSMRRWHSEGHRGVRPAYRGWSCNLLDAGRGPWQAAHMPLELQGLRTIIYPAPDLDAARAWWTRALGRDPYFDQPFYVGYDVAGYELGLLPEGNPSDGALTYWGVPDVPAAVAESLRVG